MDKLFRDAIIVNMTLLVVFILLDFLTWNAVAVNLNSRMQTNLAARNGIYPYNVTDIYSNYGLVWVGINIRYVIPYVFMPPQDSVGISINLPLIWFIVTIVVNLCVIWYSEIKRARELTKGSKQKPYLSRPTQRRISEKRGMLRFSRILLFSSNHSFKSLASCRARSVLSTQTQGCQYQREKLPPKLLTLKNQAELSKKSFKSTCSNIVLRLKEITD